MADLFEPEPEQWGLRGDPHLWAEMRSHFARTPLPRSARELRDLITSAFAELSGHSLDVDEDPFVERYDTGGMSSGHLSLEFWRERALPLLVARLPR